MSLVLDKDRKYLISWYPMPEPTPTVADNTVTETVTIELDRRSTTVSYSAGKTLLQTARMAGLQPPSSCEIGPAERVWPG